jgi:hypothetical protein
MNATLFPLPTAETAEPASLAPAAPSDDDEFDWAPNNPETVITEQPAVAVYVNPHNQVVIRSNYRGVCDCCGQEPGDPFIFISRQNLPALVRRLQQFVTR